jgi:hypothetical protein
MHMDQEHIHPRPAGPETPAVFAWCGLAGLAGIIGIAADRFFNQGWAGWTGAVLLLGAGVVGIANGWYAGTKTPPETRFGVADRIARGLVGTHIGISAGVVTVVDDSMMGGDGRRRTVKAVDGQGRLGMLFVELDRNGHVVAAALPGGPWSPASAMPAWH